MTTAYTFINHAYATDSSSLRWSQTSLGAGNYCTRSSSILVTASKIVCIDGTFGTAMFDGAWHYRQQSNSVTLPAGAGVRDIFEASDGRMYTSGRDYGTGSSDHKAYIYESTDGLTWTRGHLLGGGDMLMIDGIIELPAYFNTVWKFTEDKDGNIFAGEYPLSVGYTGIHVW